MGNCLKTQLKGVVQNDRLVGIDSIGFKISNVENLNHLTFRSFGECDIYARGGSFVPYGQQSPVYTEYHYTPSDGDIVFTFTPGTFVEITNKYQINNFSGVEISLKEFKYLTTMLGTAMATAGDLSDISANTSLLGLNVSKYPSVRTSVSGDIANLANNEVLETFRASNQPNVYGNIANLGYTNVSSLNLHNTNVTGAIEDFVAAKIESGHSTGQVDGFGYFFKTITFGGQNLNDYISVFVWESASKMYGYYSPDNTLANAEIIYAKGCSQQEIDAWEQAGKTVYVVS